jgi:serine/threonine protein kinase
MGTGAHSSETDSSSAKRSDAGDDTGVRLDECFPQRQVLLMEQTWYTSPEELENMSTTFASDIYSLGVLIFEVLNFLFLYRFTRASLFAIKAGQGHNKLSFFLSVIFPCLITEMSVIVLPHYLKMLLLYPEIWSSELL